MADTAKRYTREDWVELGLAQLRHHGPEAMTLERLTEAAGKSRGSFYHHFTDHSAFVTSMAERWLEEETDAIIAQAEGGAPTGESRGILARRAAKVDHALERELRRLAASEPIIAEAVALSDHRRITYLVDLLRRELSLDEAEALTRARIQHCAFVGAQMVFPDADERFRLTLEAMLGRTLWRS